jgi:hypothetical protein
MSIRFLTKGIAALALAMALVGCKGDDKKSEVRCEVVDRSIREVGGALEVAVSVRWSVGGTNYRTNKPIAVGRFDPAEQTRAALEERFKPGVAVGCSVDPARPTRVHLADAR